MFGRRLLAGTLLLALACGIAAGKKKKKKDEEPPTQTLPLLQDPPPAVVADAERLSFRVVPLSPKGLLSQQVRDGLKDLIRDAHGATIVKIRAFVAGTGDVRRVQTIVSEIFTDKKLPLPALTTVQGGALPGEGVQVVLESIAAEKKPTHPQGLALISGQPGDTVGQSIERLQTAIRAAGSTSADVLQATCFVSSLDNYTELRTAVAAAFPTAAMDFVQMQRVPVQTPVECEAVAALTREVRDRVEFLDRAGLDKTPAHAQVALLGPGRVVITGTQLGFGAKDPDIRLAFERLGRVLEAQHSSYKDVVYARFYPVSGDVAERVRTVRFDFMDKTRPPAGTFLPFEGLPSLDALFGVDMIALQP